MSQPASHEHRIKAVLQGMRRAENDKGGRLSRSTDTLSLIDGASYGTAEHAQRVLDWLARDADILATLRNEHLLDVGETLCIADNGCGGGRAVLSQWLNGNHAQLGGRTPLQVLRDADSARLLDAARACFAG